MAKRKNNAGTVKKKQITEKNLKANRNYKDTVFRMLFSDRKNLLSLYNAVNGTSYKNPEELEIVTLENAIYMSMKNDLSFIIDSNMPAVWALRLQWNWRSRNVSEKIFCRNFLVRIERR